MSEPASQPRYAGYGRRAGALLLDAAIFGLPALYLQHWGVGRYPGFFFYSSLAISLLWYGLSISFITRFGATPGKLILGLRIVTANGRWPNITSAFLRLLPYLVASVVTMAALYETLLQLSGGDAVQTNWHAYMHQIQGHRPKWEHWVHWLLFIPFFLAEVISVGRSKKLQSLHDLMAGTFVIYSNDSKSVQSAMT